MLKLFSSQTNRCEMRNWDKKGCIAGHQLCWPLRRPKSVHGFTSDILYTAPATYCSSLVLTCSSGQQHFCTALSLSCSSFTCADFFDLRSSAGRYDASGPERLDSLILKNRGYIPVSQWFRRVAALCESALSCGAHRGVRLLSEHTVKFCNVALGQRQNRQ